MEYARRGLPSQLTAVPCWAQAFLIEHDKDTVGFVGNRTDCALLMLLRAWGVSYEALREVRPAPYPGACMGVACRAALSSWWDIWQAV